MALLMICFKTKNPMCVKNEEKITKRRKNIFFFRFSPQKMTANYESVTENMKSFEALKSY